jgi:hypothetical protein
MVFNIMTLCGYNICFLISHLKTLLVPFNEVTSKFIEQLKPLADGATRVPMKLRFGECTLDVISKVILYELPMDTEHERTKERGGGRGRGRLQLGGGGVSYINFSSIGWFWL